MSGEKKEIIDNETGGYVLSEFLDQNVRKYDEIDIATGFFNMGGYTQVGDALDTMTDRQNGRFRLLFGKENMSGIEPDKIDYRDTVLGDLDSLVMDEERKKSVDALIKFLKKDNVLVRKSAERFSHAKCYVFDKDVAVVGSSNFTHAGLRSNIELNAVLYQPSAVKLVKEWFGKRWLDANDTKKDLIELIEESKFGLPLDPHTMYMKMLYEYYRERIDDMQNVRNVGIELTEFQQDAVTEAKRILRKYNGVVISDSTGLGKTHIGIELLRYLVQKERLKILLIAPAQVKDTVWEPRLLEESIKTKNISLESVGQPDFDPSRYLDFDIVLIDESHNFRSPTAQRRINAMKILAGGSRKKVILMSATPINNTLMDLYHQISLITAGDDLYFANLNIPDLRKHFVQATKKRKIREGIDTIVRILDEIMIKRTRTFIKENYPEATLNKKAIRFPKRNLHKVEYSLTELYGANVYSNVKDTIENMHLVPYRLVSYDRKAVEDDKKRADQISVLQRIILMKRFESSIEAIRASIKRLEKFYDMFEKAVNRDKILNSKQLSKILEEIRDDEENNEERLEEIFESDRFDIVTLGSNYDKKMLKEELKEDKKMISELAAKLERIKPFGDSKLQKLKEDIIKYNVLENGSKKMVVFTSYVDTAKYVHADLKSHLNDKKVLLLTGSVSKKKRREILEQFSPKSNHVGEEIPANLEEADVLVTTEVLSEGQNLQDCNYVVNYDLPWNPMRMVQRVGRVDRLTSEFDEITSAVFIPEKQLNDLLNIMEKLEAKIQDIGDVVGAEGSILGEKENPKTFNALDRIAAEDSSLLDEMEKSADLLTMVTPYQEVLSYIKNLGIDKLQDIRPGKRSGLCSESSGAVMMYRENSSKDIHMVLYDHKKSQIVINDITESFARIKCDHNEKLSIPFRGNDSFKYIKMINEQAVAEILERVNVGQPKKTLSNVGGKHQGIVRDRIFKGYDEERKLSREDIGSTYDILNAKSLMPWEFDLKDMVHQHNVDHDTMRLLKEVQSLVAKFRIEKESHVNKKEIKRDDLHLIGCMFLNGSDMKDTKMMV